MFWAWRESSGGAGGEGAFARAARRGPRSAHGTGSSSKRLRPGGAPQLARPIPCWQEEGSWPAHLVPHGRGVTRDHPSAFGRGPSPRRHTGGRSTVSSTAWLGRLPRPRQWKTLGPRRAIERTSMSSGGKLLDHGAEGLPIDIRDADHSVRVGATHTTPSPGPELQDLTRARAGHSARPPLGVCAGTARLRALA